MSEAAIMHECMLALSKAGCTVFRANVGLYYTKGGRPVRTGLPVGFSDLFGFTPELRPFFLEVKAERGRLRAEQVRFLEAMRERGAIAQSVRSVDECIAAVLREVAE